MRLTEEDFSQEAFAGSVTTGRIPMEFPLSLAESIVVSIGMSSCAWHSILFARASVLSFIKRARAVMGASPHWQFISVDLASKSDFHMESSGSVTICVRLPFAWISRCSNPTASQWHLTCLCMLLSAVTHVECTVHCGRALHQIDRTGH